MRISDWSSDVCSSDRRAVDARHSADRLGHRPPAVDGQHHAIVAFDAIFLRAQFDVPRRGVPVDRAPVHPRLIFGERFIFGAFAAKQLLAQAEPAVSLYPPASPSRTHHDPTPHMDSALSPDTESPHS